LTWTNGLSISSHTPSDSSAIADDRIEEFEAFFDREKAGLFRALGPVTRNRFEAEELAQDPLLSVYERWDRVAEMDYPTGYLYRTALNEFRSWHRRSAPGRQTRLGRDANRRRNRADRG